METMKDRAKEKMFLAIEANTDLFIELEQAVANELVEDLVAKTILKITKANHMPSREMREMRNKVIQFYQQPHEKVISKARQTEFVRVRQVICWLVKNQIIKNKMTLAAIGSLVGGCGHATVKHAVRTTTKTIADETHFRAAITRLIKTLGRKAEWNAETKKLTIL